nr:DnaB [Erythrotrichia foliiformis]
MNTQENIENQAKLPENTDSEKILLTGMILNSHLLQNAVDVANPEIFFNKHHKSIFRAIINVHKTGEEVGFLTVTRWLIKNNKDKDTTQELEKIKAVGLKVNNNEVFNAHLYIVIDKFLRRSLITDTQYLLNQLTNDKTSITSIINEFEAVFLRLTQQNYVAINKTALTSILPSIITEIQQKTKQQRIFNGIASGFDDLDNITDGFQQSDLIIIASRPGMGKTALVLNIARNIVKQEETAVAFFSLEMTAEQLGYRILSGESRVPLSKLKQGRIDSEDWGRIQSALHTLKKTKLYINDTPNMTMARLRNQIYQISQDSTELKAVIIDYLQLIESNVNNENRYQQISFITRSLKIIAREFNIPLIVLSQLSRNLESRTNKRPILSDLRESGCIAPESYISFHTRDITISQFSIKLHKIAFTINKNQCIVASSIKNISPGKNKISYHLFTESGYYLEASANHKVFTSNGWKKLSCITQQECIGITQSHKKMNCKNHSNINLSQFLHIKFDKIESVHISKKNMLMDLEMNKLHNFIANRIIVHNSIEQDADIVCMLYREGYYEKDEADNKIAEIAILKHRNGPTGKVELHFEERFAEFRQQNTP